jgi:uncharacterized membrane protein YccC
MAGFWDNITRFDPHKVSPWLGLRNALGVVLPLAAGAIMGTIPSGLVMATGALNVSFSDSHDPYIQRARRMLAASVVVGMGVFAGTLCGRYRGLIVLVSAVWAFAAGMLVSLSPAAADLGTISLVTLVVFAAMPMEPRQAMYAGGLALAGGLVETALALALWPLRRYVPERVAVGDLYLEIARAAAAPVRATEAPPASVQSTAAQAALSTLHRDHSVEAERYRSLLNQAERMRLALMMLGRLRTRLARENPQGAELGILDRYFLVSSTLLREIGNALVPGGPLRATPELGGELDQLAEALREACATAGMERAGMMREARFQMDALLGQIRSANDLASHATPEGAGDFERQQAATPWHLRLAGTLATLRANLSLHSAAFRHAIRLAVCVGLGEAVGRYMELRRSYWLPMTIAIVLKPDFTATISRGVLRLGGTFAGLLLATALFHVLPSGTGIEVTLIGLFTYAARTFGPANYGILVTAVTALVVLLIAVTGVAPGTVMAARALNTSLGGAIALAAYWAWPTWERTLVREAMANTLDAYRDYFRVVRRGYEQPQAMLDGDLDRTRVAGRRARSNLEASADRISVEPGAPEERVHLLVGMMASSHRLAHAMMALEAGLAASRAAASPDFRAFADGVELTLYYLAAVLRGSGMERDALPDLREEHHKLAQTGEGLVVVETDRITNSLNTLGEDVFRWVA